MRAVRFIGPLRLESHWDQDDGYWLLLEDLRAVWFDGDKTLADVTVKAGFKTDLSSIPRFVRPLLPQIARGNNKPSVPHDWLYEKVSWQDGKPLMSRAKADLMFRDGLASQGVPKWRYWLMWAGVRIGGRGKWG